MLNKGVGKAMTPIKKKFSRIDLITHFRDLGFKRGAEIGVADGQFSLALCQGIPGLSLLCIDPWIKYDENPRGGTQDNQDAAYALATERLKPYDAVLWKMKSMDAVRLVGPESLDFVYIDGHHAFDYVIQDLVEWSKRVRVGGIVSGHDYYEFRWAGVVDAVDVYTKVHKIEEWFITKDRTPSFFWMKSKLDYKKQGVRR